MQNENGSLRFRSLCEQLYTAMFHNHWLPDKLQWDMYVHVTRAFLQK